MADERITNEQRVSKVGRLGKMPAKSSTKALLFADFIKAGSPDPPKAYNFWKGKAKFPPRIFGNDSVGDCTIASQAHAAVRCERIETRRTIDITDNQVLSAYYDMTTRLYGGGDTGAFETDALDNWRNPDHTFKDTKGHPLTIDAYTSINKNDQMQLKRAIWSQAAKGIKVCWNLPAAWERFVGGVWNSPPPGQQPVGDWMPGSWGGHSTYAFGYDAYGMWIITWGQPQFITWAGVALYCDEAHWFLDSVDSWRRRADSSAKQLKLHDLIDAVNTVSSIQIGK